MTQLKNRPAQRVLALHRNFEKDAKGDPIFVIAEDGTEVKHLSGVKIAKFINGLNETVTLRITSQAYFVPILQQMQERGVHLQYCHWHKAGLAKGLSAEDIAAGYLALDASLFLPIKVNPKICDLRDFIAARSSLVDLRRSAQLKLHALARSRGFAKADADDTPDWLQAAFAEVVAEGNAKEHPLERRISNLAKTIPECILLNQVLGISDNNWITSATVIAYLGDLSRFTQVQSLRHYCGYHVAEGKAPKREKGKNITWNPKVRTALWSWSDSMIKHAGGISEKTGKAKAFSIWRPLYDEYLAVEKAQHLQVCPNCKTPDGHSGARARRKVVQQVLKKFFLAANGLEDDQAA